ncbi:hypothetical protein [Halostagnicola kamekurae]|uniref:HTH domain-containing protein n=1 Tax=Halostagnicola kamekurae TaxID=619731 RepID=A0A1I6QMR2_9EURY|nr:hypothetical protein [Halostagnicola kamekurae]SFS53726.1 hypothetical protein SAMN04488556_1380 [Halostagnicola kamekurae]
MTLPPWIAEKVERDRTVNTKLTHRHVVETMYDAERPFFSLQQIQRRIKPDVSKVTVRNRLDDLEEQGVVATEAYSDSLTLYYINHPESEWPLSPEGEQALKRESTGTQNPLFEFLKRPQVRLILREELLRSIAWAAFGLVGWALLVTSSEQLPANVWTVLGLPVLTWGSLTAGLIGIRLATDSDMQIRTRGGLHLVTLGGVVGGGFWVAFLIFVLDWSPVFTAGLYGVVTATYLVYYARVVLPRFDAEADG